MQRLNEEKDKVLAKPRNDSMTLVDAMTQSE